jgi:hypothetical protein
VNIRPWFQFQSFALSARDARPEHLDIAENHASAGKSASRRIYRVVSSFEKQRQGKISARVDHANSYVKQPRVYRVTRQGLPDYLKAAFLDTGGFTFV